MLITFSSNNLSSRLLKIEQKKYHRIFFPQISTNWFPLSSLATTTFKFRVWFVKKKLLSVLDRISFFYIKRLSSTNCHGKNLSYFVASSNEPGCRDQFRFGFKCETLARFPKSCLEKPRARSGEPNQPTLSYEHIEVRGK